MKQEATDLNKVTKQHASSRELVALSDHQGALVNEGSGDQHQQPTGMQAFDLAGLGDHHFAIAESRVDRARRDFKGNWIAVNNAAFIEQHGTVVKNTDFGGLVGDDDDEAADPDSACQDVLAPGLCVKQLDSNRDLKTQYQTLRAQCVSLLRQLRSDRRSNGYQPEHGLLLVAKKQGTNVRDILEVYVLGRVSFSPFDFTAVEYKLRDASAEADLVVQNGSAVFHHMPQLLYRLAGLWEHRWSLRTARYTALSMGSLCINEDSMQSIICLQEGPRGATGIVGSDQDDDTDEEDAVLKQRQSFLKHACGKKHDQNSKKRRLRQPVSRTTRKSVAPVANNVDESIDVEVEALWHTALEHQDGVVAQPRAEQPSSSSRASGARSEPMSRPPASEDHPLGVPWKDAKGYCFTMVANAVPSAPAKKTYIGKNLRTVEAEQYMCVTVEHCVAFLPDAGAVVVLAVAVAFRSHYGSARGDELACSQHTLR